MSKFEKIVLLTVVALFGVGIVIGLTPHDRAVAEDASRRQLTAKAPVLFPIELNSAGLQELKAIKGIGDVKAKQIIAYRQDKGLFRSVDELLEVKGIGPKTLESIREFIYVDESSLAEAGVYDRAEGTSKSGGRIDINRADLKDLVSLPGIGEVKGKRIIDYRETHGKFNEPEELIKVSGIGEKTLQAILPLICCE